MYIYMTEQFYFWVFYPSELESCTWIFTAALFVKLNTETILMSFKRKIDKQAVVHHAMSCHGILHRKKKEQAIKTQNNLKNGKDNVLSQKRQSPKACFLTMRSHGWLERCGVV